MLYGYNLSTMGLVSAQIIQTGAPTDATLFVNGDTGDDSFNGLSPLTPFRTITKAASVSMPGDIVEIAAGIYRETPVQVSSGTSVQRIKYRPAAGALVEICGLDIIPNTGWTNVGTPNANIYRRAMTLPVNGFITSTARPGNLEHSNTTIYANQIFRNGVQQVEARWPKITTSTSDRLSRSITFRNLPFDNGTGTAPAFQTTFLDDSTLPIAAPGLIGATLISNGWFHHESRTLTGHSGIRISWSQPIWDNTSSGVWFRQRYWLTGKLGLLTQPTEFHYESGNLYFWQQGGGTPSGTIEYKARNYGFDIRNKSYITFEGITYRGCEIAFSNEFAHSIIVNKCHGTFLNHHIRHDYWEWQGVGMSKMFGTKLIGDNCVFTNNEFSDTASTGIWMGQNCRAENNHMSWWGYAGNWAHPLTLWGTKDNQIIRKNRIHNCGRSCFDFGFGFGEAPGTAKNFNVEVSYNWFSDFGLLSSDLGATYTWGQKDLTGMNYHHNWANNNLAPGQWNGVTNGHGIGAAFYFDQATGPGVLHHNVSWGPMDSDVYHETTNNERPVDGVWTHPDTRINFYNNSFVSTSGGNPVSSYRSYISDPKDPQVNNIYRRNVVVNWTWQPGGGLINHITNSIFPVGHSHNGSLGSGSMIGTPTFVGGNPDVIGGLAFQLASGSLGINQGAVIAGITDGHSGAAPDIGAYEFGQTPWVAGWDPNNPV